MFDIEVSKQMNYVPWVHSPVTKAINLVNDGSIVLDIGCSYGYVGKALKKRNCKVYGVEVDEEMGRIAEKEYEKVVICDLNSTQSLPFENKYFNYILCLDVLEHLYRPDVVLKYLKIYLKDNGFIIISLPNVARIEHRLSLLFGNFNYSEYGAISKAHIRFFNRKTAQRLVEEAGYRILKIDYTGFASIIKIFPNLTTYQFLITASL